MKRSLAAVVVLLCTAAAAFAQPPESLRFGTDKPRYHPGATVTIELVNDTASDITITGDWYVENKSGEQQSHYQWPQEEATIAPGDKRVWPWNQHQACFGECQNVWEGMLVGPGHYVAVAPTDAGELRAEFDIGRYFTLGFDSSPDDTFIVFVNERKPIRQMKKEAKAKDKSLIVSGIVSEGADYNDPWSYTMGSGTIVLGEAFIEVCDANPHYVEENRDEWMGERWCPWSSFVAKSGR